MSAYSSKPCVSPRVFRRPNTQDFARSRRAYLADIEAGKRNVRLETLEKLLRPFGYRIGVVSPQDPRA